MSSPITTHILDTSLGKPGAGIRVELELGDAAGQDWKLVGSGSTNGDGRVTDLLEPKSLNSGRYRISFFVDEYFKKQEVASFYPIVHIEFLIDDNSQHYHVPLLLNPFGYSTYRGS